ncbi:MAG: PcfJ domain-containing protein [Clostridiaceae bacterium]
MLDEYLSHVNLDISNDIKKFVENDVFGNSEYLFINISEKTGYCTKCNKEHSLESIKIKHNETVRCPSCGAILQAKSLRYGRKNCFNDACFYYFEKSIAEQNAIVCKGYYVSKDYYVDYKNPKVNYILNALYIFKIKNSKMLKQQYSHYYGESWRETKSIFDFNTGWLAPKMCYCSFKSIKNAIKDTDFQYMPIKKYQGHYSMVKLFDEYSKYPNSIEYLTKEGLANLVEGKLNGNPTLSAINWKGKTIFQILKISRQELKELKSQNVDITFQLLKVFQVAKKHKWNLDTKELVKVTKEYWINYDALIAASEYSSIRKILNYLEKQFAKHNIIGKDKHYYDKASVLTHFKDYITDCNTLGIDIKNSSALFPKNLFNAHQNTIKQVKIKNNEKFDILIKKRSRVLEKFTYKLNGLIIRPVASSKELIEEGATLHHCVGGYAERYAKGETNILVIRKETELEKPYFTVEVSKSNTIIQVRGKNNSSASEDVKLLIETFKDEKLNKKKSKTNVAKSA